MRRPLALLAGTSAMIADVMEDWFKVDARDGFILPPTVFPTTFEEFGRMVVPDDNGAAFFARPAPAKTCGTTWGITVGGLDGRREWWTECQAGRHVGNKVQV